MGSALALGAVLFIAYLMSAPGPYAFAGGTHVPLSAYPGNSSGAPVELANADLLTRGEYLTTAADCAACHTVKGGTPFVGGRAFKLPFGILYTPNITPDRATGIGAWNDADFIRAMRRGVARDGTRLYPAFPYASYAMMSDADILAIKAYLFSLKPVSHIAPPNALAFPFNQRWLMAVWGAMFNRQPVFEPVVERSAAWNRGAYLAEALAHCGECHSSRNLMQAVDNRRKFAGGAAEGWNAYNISSDRKGGVGTWTQDQLRRYLATGYAPGKGVASGPMAEAIDISLRHLKTSDIAAIAEYLATVPASEGELPALKLTFVDRSTRIGPSDNPVGKQIFAGACASCHAWNGAGAIVDEARLTGNRSINDPSPANVAHMILDGNGRPGGSVPYMPSFKAAYSDTEVAEVANFVVDRFGTTPSRLNPGEVARMRRE